MTLKGVSRRNSIGLRTRRAILKDTVSLEGVVRCLRPEDCCKNSECDRGDEWMVWHTIRYDGIDAFKKTWPAHGLPDDLHSLSVETDANGDVVDIEAYKDHEDGSSEQIEWRDFDGQAFKALVDDCVELGDISPAASPVSTAGPGI